jgi:hypothetical protein
MNLPRARIDLHGQARKIGMLIVHDSQSLNIAPCTCSSAMSTSRQLTVPASISHHANGAYDAALPEAVAA